MDIATLSFAIGLFSMLITLMVGFYAIFRQEQALWAHAGGFLSGVVGFFLLGMQGRLHPILGVVLSNTLVAIFLFLIAMGLRLALGAPRAWPRRFTVVLMLWLAFHLYATFVFDLPWIRALVFAFLIILPQCECLTVILKRRHTLPGRASWILVGFSAAFILLYAWRFVLLVRLGPKDYAVLGATASAAYTFILSLAFTTIWAGLVILIDVSGLLGSLAKKNRELERLACSDPLTGLYNRKRMEDDLVRELDLKARTGGVSSIIMFDLDHFKEVNDALGHAAGDRALLSVSRTILATIRQTDSVYRWGGEEFFVLAPDTDSNGAGQEAERLRAVIENTVHLPDRKITASFGYAACRTGDTMDSWVHRADSAMYRSKEGGRNRVSEG